MIKAKRDIEPPLNLPRLGRLPPRTWPEATEKPQIRYIMNS